MRSNIFPGQRLALFLSLIATAMLVGACDVLLTDRLSERLPGIIQWDVQPELQQGAKAASADEFEAPVLEAPDSVRVGESFQIAVRTYGSDGCWRAAGETVSSSGMSVEITPYDERNTSRSVLCPTMIVRLPRTVTLSFSQPGEATLFILGRVVLESPTAAGFRSDLGTIEHRIVVVE
jgi:hypothetical protein